MSVEFPSTEDGAGAWGIQLGPSFRVALWFHCCPLGEERVELWVLSLAGQKKLKEVAFLGPLGGWKASVCHLALVGNQGSRAPYSLRIF